MILSSWVGLALTRLVGLLMRDVALTRDEVVGLMAGLLTSEAAPTGTTRLSDWLFPLLSLPHAPKPTYPK